jgi:maleate isomerase
VNTLRLGMLTPSSNTVLEPVSSAMLSGAPNVTVHFSRFKVTEIALSDQALGQFDLDEIMRAAELLAHAKVDTIAWNGTSASWLGFDRDEALCERITASTGIAACTSSLAFREIFQRTATRRVGLVTPYLDDVQTKIMDNWAASGFACSAERHLRLQDNFSFATVSEDTISEMVRAVVQQGCEAVAILCTNMRGARIVDALERELGVPIYDSVATTIWKSLLLAGEEPRKLGSWGRLYRDDRLNDVRHLGSVAE